jgi:gliding motility-associated-like protein
MIRTYLISLLLLTLLGSCVYAQSNPNGNTNNEIKTERSMYSKVYLNEKGEKEVVYSSSPIHYLKNGKWEEINTNIVSDNTHFKNDENLIKSFFPKINKIDNKIKLLVNSSDEILIHSVKKLVIFNTQSKLNVLNVNSNNPLGEINKNSIIYPNIYDGISDEFTIANGEVKNNVILNSTPALLDNVSTGYFGFREIIELPDGWEIESLDKTDDLLISSSLKIIDSNGNHVLTIPEPIFFDNYGLESDGSNMVVGKYLLKEEAEHWSLTTLVPIEWLKNENTIYPVSIDPTVILAGATGGWQSPVNFVDNPAYVFAGDCCGNGHHRAWIKFNTTSIPDNSCITNVELQLYVSGVGGTPLELVHANDVTGAPGPYGGINPAAFADFGNGLYTSFSLGGIGTYGYYDLGVNADALLQAQLPVNWFQVALMFDNEPSTNWKKMTATSCNLRVTYGNCCPTADFTINTPICLGDTTTATYTGIGATSATTFDWNFVGGMPATANTIGPHDVTWATSGTKTVSLEVNQAGCPTEILTQNVVVNPNPGVTISANPSSICIGTTTTLTANTTVAGTTYNWSTGSTTNPLSVSPTVTTTYTVTGTGATGCTGTASVTVIVNPNLNPTITAAPSSVCEGNGTTLTAGNVPAGSTYNWSTGSTLNPLNVTPAATTSYQVTATDGNGCTGTATVSVTVNPNPIISATANPTAICVGASSTISATTSVGGTTYNWDQGLGAGTSHIVFPAVTTTYTVTGTTANGCIGTSTVSVTVNPGPVISAVASPDSICSGSNSTLTATSSIVSTSYTWSNGATTTNTQSVSPTVNTTYTVTGTTTGGCVGTATVNVYIRPDVLPTLTAVPSAICLGDSTDISISNIPNGTSFLWSNSSTTTPLTVIPSTTTTYNVTVTTIEGCTGLSNIQITVNPLPQIQVSNDTICNGDIGSLLASGASTYLWNNSTTVNPLTDNPSVTTIYTVIGTDVNGCSSTGQGDIYVIDPLTLLLSSTDAHCNQNDGSVTVIATGGSGVYTYSWNTTPISTTSTVNSVPPGTYSVTVTDNGCTNVSSVNVGNISGPIAAFIADPTEAEINENILFTDLSIGAISWDWSFGDWGTSVLENPIHTYASQGIYDVWLHIEDNYGCKDSTTSRIIINSLFTIYIPNAFSPDGNGVNEIFIPSGVGIDEEKYVMQIYDRWGNRIFETTDIGIGWDGNIEGQEISEMEKMSAVFVYYIKLYEDGTGVSHEYRGTITLLK